jgi:membrane protein
MRLPNIATALAVAARLPSQPARATEEIAVAASASDVKARADVLAHESETLESRMRSFLSRAQAHLTRPGWPGLLGGRTTLRSGRSNCRVHCGAAAFSSRRRLVATEPPRGNRAGSCHVVRRRCIFDLPASRPGLYGRPLSEAPLSIFRNSLRFAVDAFLAFVRDDGWAIASHIALSMLMSLFPFLIFVTALTGYLSTPNLSDQVATILLEAWPQEVAGPIAAEIASVLTNAHGSLLTIGVVLALYFSSSSIESLRIGLNRAYGELETRSWWLLRLESIAYVVVGAAALIALSFLIVLWPVMFRAAQRFLPKVMPIEDTYVYLRFAIASAVLVIALILVHKWLPAGRRHLRDVVPGIVVTLVMWLMLGILFGRYLAEFAGAYVTMYAGLATAMVALVFLYWTASIFVYGGELNAVIRRAREKAVSDG